MGGYHFVYALYRQDMKHEMKAWLSDHKNAALGDRFCFTVFNDAVSDPSFSWEEEGEEFSYHGEMYDVVSLHYENDKLIINALKDGKETQIDQQLSALNHKRNEDKSRILLKLFPVFICDVSKEDNVSSFGVRTYSAPRSQDIFLLHNEILTPPPRTA